jgi:hypothetical protein
MWRLISDQVRRNRWPLALNGLVFANLLFLHGVVHKSAGSRFDFVLFVIYALWPMSWSGLGKSYTVRIWRMLPFRESSLANLAWYMSVPLPSGSIFLIVLLMSLLGIAQAENGPSPTAWPLLVLLFGVLSTGAFTFASASIRHQLAQKRSTLYRLRLGFGIAFPVTCTAIALALMLNPTPTGWQDLQSSHLAGLFLGALLTLLSYSFRAWLLQPFKPQYTTTPEAPAHNDASLPRTSILLAIARDFVTSARGMALLVIAILAYYFLWIPLLSGLGWLSPAREGNRGTSFASAMGAFLMTFAALSHYLTRFLMTLKTIRTLPLSTSGCVRLLLGYPYGLSLILIPCVAVILSNCSLGRFSTVFIAGVLISASLCPWAMFIAARFGMRVFLALCIFGTYLASLAAFILPISGTPLTSLSAPALIAVALATAPIGILGYYGLRRLIENSSDAYKPKLLPQQFGQGLGR